jgi:hypothetical protein
MYLRIQPRLWRVRCNVLKSRVGGLFLTYLKLNT